MSKHAAAIVGVFLALYIPLSLYSASRRSATWDEPMHLTAGYLAVSQQDFRADPSHPPLLRMWAALPVVAAGRTRADTGIIDRTASGTWLGDAYGFAHRFMYVDNDADRMLHGARIMAVLLAALLGVLVFCWTREWFGLVPAALTLLLYTLEPNLMAHGSLVTTDLGVTLFVFATVYAVWRIGVRPTALNVPAAVGCAALAVTAKFSALLLAPVTLLLLAVAVVRRQLRLSVAAGLAAAMTVAAVTAVWAVYGFRFLPSDSPGWAFDFTTGGFAKQSPALAALVGWIDSHRLLPNAFTQGLLYTQASVDTMPAFLSGKISQNGWWYYFPVAFLLKTPIALVALTIGGLAVVARRRRGPPLKVRLKPDPTSAFSRTGAPVFVVVPIAVFLGTAMASGVNLGVRHVLPIYPFALLLAGGAIHWLLARRHTWGPAMAATLLLAAAAEFVRAYPYPLAFFNQLAGGPANGYRYLADSNLGWGGNLKPLKAWMDGNGVSHINLAYFGQADPRYYGIGHTHLPGAPGFAIDEIRRPRLPGYVAISPTVMHGVYTQPQWRLFYAPFRDLEPAAVIGHSLRVFWVERWPEATGLHVDGVPVETHRVLGDALLFGLQWPEEAMAHYREYLRYYPGQAGALRAHLARLGAIQ